MGVSKNRGTPKWMVYNGKPYWNGWFGVPLFSETSICVSYRRLMAFLAHTANGYDAQCSTPNPRAFLKTIFVNGFPRIGIVFFVSATVGVSKFPFKFLFIYVFSSDVWTWIYSKWFLNCFRVWMLAGFMRDLQTTTRPGLVYQRVT